LYYSFGRRIYQIRNIECYGGYFTSFPLEVLMDTDVLFAYIHDGIELELIFGGFVRFMFQRNTIIIALNGFIRSFHKT